MLLEAFTRWRCSAATRRGLCSGWYTLANGDSRHRLHRWFRPPVDGLLGHYGNGTLDRRFDVTR